MENNFLTRITAPTLGSSTFATDLREVFQNIDDNFKKIVSAPYLEGQEGNSVEAYDMPIVEDGELTDFGAAMMREILSDPDIYTIEDITSNRNYDSVGPRQQHTVYEYILENPTMKVLRVTDPDYSYEQNLDTCKWICSAEYYCFVDMRVEDLGNCGYPSSQTQFVDYSCVVFAEYRDDGWVFTKGNMMPVLYYSTDQSCFCWKINGMETGIRAQGIKGDDGRPPKAAVVMGTGSLSENPDTGARMVRVNVSKYSYIYTRVEDEEIHTYTDWGNIQDSGLQDGDLVVCIFSIVDDIYGIGYPDMIIANIRITGELDSPESMTYTITAPDMNRMSSLWRSYLLFYACKDIDYKTTDTDETKALFIPSSTEDLTHAIFQDDSGVVYSQDLETGEWVSEDTLEKNNLVFKKVKESRLVGEGSLGNRMIDSDADDPDVSETTKVKFLGYDMEVEGTSKAKVSGIPYTLLGCPVGSVVYWLSMSNIPEGWFATGEVEQHYPPVFGIQYTDDDSEDYDIYIHNSDDSFYKKAIITGIGENEDFGERDKRFLGIFCTLSGHQFGYPVDVVTSCNSVEDLAMYETYDWNMFDIYRDNLTYSGAKFYLTKQVQQDE